MNTLSIEELKEMREMAEVGLQRRTILALDELIAIRELKADQVPPTEHSDDFHFDLFAACCKEKLAIARKKGRSGWDNPEVCSVEHLAELLVHHLTKGNAGTFEDIANFAMMLHQRSADPKVLARAVRSLRFTPAEKDAVERALNAQPSKSVEGDQVPYAYSYNYAGCETCEGFQDWRKELSRERPPEWMVETGKVTDLVELFTAPQKPIVPVGFIHHLDVAELKAGGDAEIKPHKTADWQIPVFTAPQKPVVKLAGDMPRAPFNYGMYANGWNDRGLADKLGIEAAGGVVKDGE